MIQENAAILNHSNIENYAQIMRRWKGRRQIGHSDMILFYLYND